MVFYIAVEPILNCLSVNNDCFRQKFTHIVPIPPTHHESPLSTLGDGRRIAVTGDVLKDMAATPMPFTNSPVLLQAVGLAKVIP